MSRSKRKTAAQWRILINEYHQSNMDSQAFCKAQQIHPTTFSKWRCHFAREHEVNSNIAHPKESSAHFVAIEPGKTSQQPSTQPSSHALVTCQLPNGVTLQWTDALPIDYALSLLPRSLT